MELIGTCEFLEDSVREAEQQAQTVPYEQALTMLNTLPFIQNVQETAQPEANQSAVKVQIHEKPVWLMLDMLYLDQVFSQNINGKGDVIIADSGGINDRKEDLQSFIVCSAPLFDDGLTVVKYIDRQDVLNDVIYWGDLSLRVTLIMIIASMSWSIRPIG